MQGTIDFLGELARNAVHREQVLDAGPADAPCAAEALQQFGAFLRPDAGNLLERARSGANTGTARPHAGDREAVRLVADLRHEHERRRLAAERNLGPAVGEDQLLEADLPRLALLDADDTRELDAELLEHLAR